MSAPIRSTPTSAAAAPTPSASSRLDSGIALTLQKRSLGIGLALAAAVFVADRVSKQWILGLLEQNALPIEVTPFFNLVFTWNRGITFGLFNSAEGAGWGRWVLLAVTGAIALGLLVWLARAAQWWVVVALGLVIGGAVGNLVDRVLYGAVADFLDFHLLGYHWYVFNVADSAIVCGVGLLLLDSLLLQPKPPR
jgi:signal peptidase II